MKTCVLLLSIFVLNAESAASRSSKSNSAEDDGNSVRAEVLGESNDHGHQMDPSVKEKRCKDLDYLVGGSHNLKLARPLGLTRRDVQSSFKKRQCETCKATRCIPGGVCDSCSIWCKENPVNIKTRSTDSVVGIAPRMGQPSSDVGLSEAEDRYYTIGSFGPGPIQTLLAKLLNVPKSIKLGKLVILAKNKAKSPSGIAHPVIIDTAHVFSVNDGQPAELELELHNVKNLNSDDIETLTSRLNKELDAAIETKKKIKGEAHLTPGEIDKIIDHAVVQHNAKKSNPDVPNGQTILGSTFTKDPPSSMETTTIDDRDTSEEEGNISTIRPDSSMFHKKQEAVTVRGHIDAFDQALAANMEKNHFIVSDQLNHDNRTSLELQSNEEITTNATSDHSKHPAHQFKNDENVKNSDDENSKHLHTQDKNLQQEDIHKLEGNVSSITHIDHSPENADVKNTSIEETTDINGNVVGTKLKHKKFEKKGHKVLKGHGKFRMNEDSISEDISHKEGAQMAPADSEMSEHLKPRFNPPTYTGNANDNKYYNLPMPSNNNNMQSQYSNTHLPYNQHINTHKGEYTIPNLGGHQGTNNMYPGPVKSYIPENKNGPSVLHQQTSLPNYINLPANVPNIPASADHYSPYINNMQQPAHIQSPMTPQNAQVNQYPNAQVNQYQNAQVNQYAPPQNIAYKNDNNYQVPQPIVHQQVSNIPGNQYNQNPSYGAEEQIPYIQNINDQQNGNFQQYPNNYQGNFENYDGTAMEDEFPFQSLPGIQADDGYGPDDYVLGSAKNKNPANTESKFSDSDVADDEPRLGDSWYENEYHKLKHWVENNLKQIAPEQLELETKADDNTIVDNLKNIPKHVLDGDDKILSNVDAKNVQININPDTVQTVNQSDNETVGCSIEEAMHLDPINDYGNGYRNNENGAPKNSLFPKLDKLLHPHHSGKSASVIDNINKLLHLNDKNPNLEDNQDQINNMNTNDNIDSQTYMQDERPQQFESPIQTPQFNEEYPSNTPAEFQHPQKQNIQSNFPSMTHPQNARANRFNRLNGFMMPDESPSILSSTHIKSANENSEDLQPQHIIPEGTSSLHEFPLNITKFIRPEEFPLNISKVVPHFHKPGNSADLPPKHVIQEGTYPQFEIIPGLHEEFPSHSTKKITPAVFPPNITEVIPHFHKPGNSANSQPQNVINERTTSKSEIIPGLNEEFPTHSSKTIRPDEFPPNKTEGIPHYSTAINSADPQPQHFINGGTSSHSKTVPGFNDEFPLHNSKIIRPEEFPPNQMEGIPQFHKSDSENPRGRSSNNDQAVNFNVFHPKGSAHKNSESENFMNDDIPQHMNPLSFPSRIKENIPENYKPEYFDTNRHEQLLSGNANENVQFQRPNHRQNIDLLSLPYYLQNERLGQKRILNENTDGQSEALEGEPEFPHHVGQETDNFQRPKHGQPLDTVSLPHYFENMRLGQQTGKTVIKNPPQSEGEKEEFQSHIPEGSQHFQRPKHRQHLDSTALQNDNFPSDILPSHLPEETEHFLMSNLDQAGNFPGKNEEFPVNFTKHIKPIEFPLNAPEGIPSFYKPDDSDLNGSDSLPEKHVEISTIIPKIPSPVECPMDEPENSPSFHKTDTSCSDPRNVQINQELKHNSEQDQLASRMPKTRQEFPSAIPKYIKPAQFSFDAPENTNSGPRNMHRSRGHNADHLQLPSDIARMLEQFPSSIPKQITPVELPFDAAKNVHDFNQQEKIVNSGQEQVSFSTPESALQMQMPQHGQSEGIVSQPHYLENLYLGQKQPLNENTNDHTDEGQREEYQSHDPQGASHFQRPKHGQHLDTVALSRYLDDMHAERQNAETLNENVDQSGEREEFESHVAEGSGQFQRPKHGQHINPSKSRDSQASQFNMEDVMSTQSDFPRASNRFNQNAPSEIAHQQLVTEENRNFNQKFPNLLDTNFPTLRQANEHILHPNHHIEQQKFHGSERFTDSLNQHMPQYDYTRMGKIVPQSLQDLNIHHRDVSEQLNEPQKVYFVGDGMKIPLHLTKNKDGTTHLSIDISQMCKCKSTSCMKKEAEDEKIAYGGNSYDGKTSEIFKRSPTSLPADESIYRYVKDKAILKSLNDEESDNISPDKNYYNIDGRMRTLSNDIKKYCENEENIKVNLMTHNDQRLDNSVQRRDGLLKNILSWMTNLTVNESKNK